MGRSTTRWFEVTIPGGDPRGVIRDSFVQDCVKSASVCGVPVDDVLFDDSDLTERFLLPPDVARVYFFHPYRSALADWLLITGMARPCSNEPKLDGLKRLPAE